jgi:ATP-binding cassette subfamily B protein
VQSADRILVLDGGRVIAEGAHAELYGKNDLYTHLAGLQLGAA